jgi:hypothetical protein
MAGEDLTGDKGAAADLGAWLRFGDQSGQALRPEAAEKGAPGAAAAIPLW